MSRKYWLAVAIISITLGLVVGLVWRIRSTELVRSVQQLINPKRILSSEMTPQALPDYTLTNQEGLPTNISDLRGRPVLLTFAFTQCPDICPTALADFKRIKRELGLQGDQVTFAMVSVDGDRDTPEALKKYLALFDRDFVGLTGAPDIVRPVADVFGAQFEINKTQPDQTNYSVSHTSFQYLIDQYGRWRKTYAFQTQPSSIASDLKTLLNEPPLAADKLTISEVKPKPLYMSAPQPMPEFILTDQSGHPFSSTSLAGRPTLLFFGATECLDTNVCTELMEQFMAVKRELGPAAAGMRFMMISVDGKRDTPAVMSAYLAEQDSAFIGLTGDPQVTAPFAVKNGVHVELRAGVNGAVTRHIPHPAYSMLLDARGRWVLSFPIKLQPSEVAAEIRKVLDM
jgi:protein SCO1/2